MDILEEICKNVKDKNGLDSSENTQIEIIHKALFEELKIEEFKQNLGSLEYNVRHQFLNGCFFLKGAMELQSDYCEAIKVAMFFTAIEAIVGIDDFMTFEQWITSKKGKGTSERDDVLKEISPSTFKSKIKEASKIYFENYGVTEHVRKFFRDCLDIKDKKKIIFAFKVQMKEDNLFAHKCYVDKEKCFTCEYTGDVDTFRCKKRGSHCIESKSEKDVDNVLDKVISDLYHIFRNEIIHRGNRSHILLPHKVEGGICAGNSLLLLFRKGKNPRGAEIYDDLNYENLYELIKKGIKKYYDSFLVKGDDSSM